MRKLYLSLFLLVIVLSIAGCNSTSSTQPTLVVLPFPSPEDQPATPSDTPFPIPVETSSAETALSQLSPSPTTGNLKVEIITDIIACFCDGRGNYGNVQVTINFLNGEPIFEISGQEPVRSRTAKFEVPLRSELYLVLTSSDGLHWEGPVEIPRQCIIDTNACNEPPARSPTDTPEPPWCQFFPQLCD